MRTNLMAVAAMMMAATIATAQDDDLPVATAVPTADATADSGASEADPPVAQPTDNVPVTRPLSATITLINQSVIRGTLTDTTEIEMKSSVGEITIPLSEVAGVRFATQDETTTTVVMLNGDSFTGATDVQLLMVETEWGQAKIRGTGVAGVMLVPSLQWTQVDGLNGKRWYLTEENRPVSPVRASSGSTIPRSPIGTQFRPN